ncbi:MAG: hypothetical protein NC040_09505 [Muribaculaceae bacterium]|nr:hypothetical protein [Alistipes senegalensis]MCM1474285.1 hypothetical protein [Muribaculaceae bacterium]
MAGFKEIIDMNCYFVDKTMFIRDIIDSGSKVTQGVLEDTADDTVYLTALKLISDCLYEVYNKR